MRTVLVSVLILLLSVSAYSVDEHAARLQQIATKKAAEAHNANAHANTLLSSLKSKLESHTPSVRSDEDAVSHIKSIHDEHVASFQRTSHSSKPEQKHQWADDLGPQHKMHSTLAAHGVSDKLVREINNMASSNIHREAIVQHVQTHFPDKEPHEWNDIVVSAIGVAGKEQPDVSQTTKSSRNEALLQRQKFKRDKRALENKQDQQS